MQITNATYGKSFELAKEALRRSPLGNVIRSFQEYAKSSSKNKGLITWHFWLKSDLFKGRMSAHVTVRVGADGSLQADDNIIFAGQTAESVSSLGPAHFYWGKHGWMVEALT